MKLTDLQNIGKTLAEELTVSGVSSIEEFNLISLEELVMKLKESGFSVCLNKLYALEGAKQGIRWHNLSTERKAEIKNLI